MVSDNTLENNTRFIEKCQLSNIDQDIQDYAHISNSKKQDCPDDDSSFGSGKDIENATIITAVDVASIPERKLSVIQAFFLLSSEYIVLAILAFPASFSTLGLAGGIIASFFIAIATAATSHILWRYCMRHRKAHDVCDLAQILTGSRVGWYAAFVGLALNNYFIMGLHVVAGATAIQTIRGGHECTLLWSVGVGLIMFVFSLIRDYNLLSKFSLIASLTMLVCYLIVTISSSQQGHPNGYKESTPVVWTAWASSSTTFAQGVSALMNIVYTYGGQILVPSFVLDMENPEKFPRVLYMVTLLQFIVYTSCGIVVYVYTGNDYVTAPAYGSLIAKYGKVAAGFVLPTCLILGMMYSLVTSKSIFNQIFKETSPHRRHHTVRGWLSWFLIVLVGWIIAFIIGEAIPFFSDLVSLISSIFDSWFCYLMWGIAGLLMLREDGGFFQSSITTLEFVFCIIWIVMGLFFEGPGTYGSIQSIITSYHEGAIKSPFQCTNSGFTFTA